MNSKYVVLMAFVFVAAIQLYVPAKMILDREEVLATGTDYKFLTAPVDPSDPFRGKYIVLSFDQNTVEVENGELWASGDDVFISLTQDSDGFAKISSASKERPGKEQEYILGTVNYVWGDNSNKLDITYPFDRYYMEESKAYDAELTYRDSQSDTSAVTYALVSVLDGDAVLKDVLIDGVSIKKIVKANQAKEPENQQTDAHIPLRAFFSSVFGFTAWI